MADEKQFVIRITSRFIERIVYILIIIALLAVIILQNTGVILQKTNNTAAEGSASTTLAEVQGSQSASTTTQATATTLAASTTTSSTTLSSGDTSLSGNVVLSFSGNPVVSEAGKVTKIEFTIENKAAVSFIPRIEFYWYDVKTDTAIKDKVRGEWSLLTGINAGQSRTASQTTFTSSYVGKDEKKETFVMKLYNRETGALLTSASKTIDSVVVEAAD